MGVSFSTPEKIVFLFYFLLLTSAGKQVCNVELIEGDTIVMGSDGLFDNVFDHEILQTISRYKDVAEAGSLLHRLVSEIQIYSVIGFTNSAFILLLAKELANLASSHATDSNFDSPYSLEARSKVREEVYN